MTESDRGARTNRLPWTLVAILSVVVLLLLVAISQQRAPQGAEPAGDPTAPATQPSADTPPSAGPQPSAGTQPSAPGTPASQQAPEETMDPNLKSLLEKLPRRDPNDVTAMGDVDAPVVLIEWSDYRCPFCALWATDTKPQLQRYVDDGTLRIEFRDLPMFGEDSERAAAAARAAGLQGKFWEFHDAVFAEAPGRGHPDIKDADVLRIAEQVGVPDLEKFEADRVSPAVVDAMNADRDEARQLGLTSTPFFVVNYEIISGAQPAEVFIAAVENAAGQ